VSGNTTRDLLSRSSKRSVANSISDRLSQELVIALIGPIGSGVSTAASYLSAILSDDFGYKVFPIIKPSTTIQAEAHRVGKAPPAALPLETYISEMQTAGNELRERFGGNYLAEKIVESIYKYRMEAGGFAEGGVPLPGRRAFIIDSLKNPEELALLRQIYGETLCVFGIFAPDEPRIQRLKSKGLSGEAVKKIIDRDSGEVATFGQKTRKIFVDSNFFICNDRKLDELNAKLKRFLHLIFATKIHTPLRAESAMYEASSAALNSACMSRQVGAAIISEQGELISVGWNDVPKFGGGLYTEDRQSVWDSTKKSLMDKDNRCFKWGGCICHNDSRRTMMVEKIARKIMSSRLLKKGVDYQAVLKILEGTEIDSLIEFSRSIHAEMEAILSVAREGRHSLVGATLYTTTYPCHNCARHIVASGIRSVIYIEPYEKSLAIALHHDAISEDADEKDRVVFRQYDGVAPRSFLKLFRTNEDRKASGKVVPSSAKTAVPLFQEPLDGPAEYEAKVIADLVDKEHCVIAG
jgi:deoxycytidylate deaminase